MGLAIDNLTKRYSELSVYENFSLSIPENKITCILGPSGCGKTTLLNLISGLMKPDGGKLKGFQDKVLSYLFQEPRLLEWKTVYDNLDFVLKDLMAPKDRGEVVNKYLKMVNLLEFKDYYPNKLSGGMKQRVAIARAFAYPSEILLMDEPFKALDMQLKMSILDDFVKLWNADQRTVILVTHDIEEALYLADVVYVFSCLPAQVTKTLNIDIPRLNRNLHEKKLAELKKELSSAILCGHKVEVA